MRAFTRNARVPLPVLALLVAAGIGVGRWLLPAPAVAPAVATPVMPSFAPIVDRVRDGVVGVRAHRPGTAAHALTDDVVSGSGFVIHADGLVVTNHHIVAGADAIEVDLPDMRTRQADVVGVDPVTDIAVLRLVDPPDDLLALQLGDSTHMRQGDWVVTVGNPFDYHHTVTAGVISYVGRHIHEKGLLVSNEYLQFSAPVHPGSSGGPLLDARGLVVGVITASHGTDTGLSFAVPSKVLRWVIEAMSETGRVERGWLGIGLRPVDPEVRQSSGLSSDGGALVSEVKPDTPAERAGLRKGDVVVAWDGQPVPDAYTLFDWITYARPGEHASVEVVRHAMRMPPMQVQLGAVDWREADTDGAPRTTQAN